MGDLTGMAYYVELADRDCLPIGLDWMFMQRPDGDCVFVLARDAERIALPKCALEGIATAAAESDCLDPWRVVSKMARAS